MINTTIGSQNASVPFIPIAIGSETLLIKGKIDNKYKEEDSKTAGNSTYNSTSIYLDIFKVTGNYFTDTVCIQSVCAPGVNIFQATDYEAPI